MAVLYIADGNEADSIDYDDDLFVGSLKAADGGDKKRGGRQVRDCVGYAGGIPILFLIGWKRCSRTMRISALPRKFYTLLGTFLAPALLMY
jgi:hypothetical protein